MAALVCKTLLRRPKTSDKSYINDLSGVNGCNGIDKLIMKTSLSNAPRRAKENCFV